MKNLYLFQNYQYKLLIFAESLSAALTILHKWLDKHSHLDKDYKFIGIHSRMDENGEIFRI